MSWSRSLDLSRRAALVRRPGRSELVRAGSWVARPGTGVVLLVLVFLSVSFWWVSVDKSLPDGDNGKHINFALNFYDYLRTGHPLGIMLAWTEYPPLVHTVGALGAVVGGAGIGSVILAGNLVFVPLLALGCYGVGREVAGPVGGLLAAIFAFASPMIIGLFHVFMLDPPEAAAVAIAVWLLLLTRRFESLPYTLAAAVAVAAGFYVKATFVLFVAGLVAMLLARGGWRNWRGFAVFAGVVLILIEPWYFMHFNELRGQANSQAVAQLGAATCVPYRCPERWSLGNFTWYGWNLVNVQLYLPLALFFLAGLLTSLWLIVRRQAGRTYLPELVVGALVAYVGISWLSLDDPRYSLPMLVYVAVLGTAWIVRVPRLAAIPVALALVAILALNLVTISRGEGPSKTFVLYPQDKPDVEGYLTVIRPVGYTVGGPTRSDLRESVTNLLRDARADGAVNVIFQPESLNNGGFNLYSLAILARIAGLGVPGFSVNLVGPDDIYVFRQPPPPGTHPCLRLIDGTALFMTKGSPTTAKTTFCPPHRS